MTSTRSRPSNSLETNLGASANDGSYEILWTWSPIPSTPLWGISVTTSVVATATIWSGACNALAPKLSGSGREADDR
ncbi:MAG: hypothetical protein QM758_06045 [Armatimonas sp.]